MLAGLLLLAGCRIDMHVQPKVLPLTKSDFFEDGRASRALVPGTHVEAVTPLDAALDRALATGDGPMVVAGSLYLVGEARRRWLDDPLVRDPAPVP